MVAAGSGVPVRPSEAQGSHPAPRDSENICSFSIKISQSERGVKRRVAEGAGVRTRQSERETAQDALGVACCARPQGERFPSGHAPTPRLPSLPLTRRLQGGRLGITGPAVRRMCYAVQVPYPFKGRRLPRGVAQLGSAPAWGAGGPAFKSRRPDQYVSQMIESSALSRQLALL